MCKIMEFYDKVARGYRVKMFISLKTEEKIRTNLPSLPSPAGRDFLS